MGARKNKVEEEERYAQGKIYEGKEERKEKEKRNEQQVSICLSMKSDLRPLTTALARLVKDLEHKLFLLTLKIQ